MSKWSHLTQQQTPHPNGLKFGPQHPKYPDVWRKEKQLTKCFFLYRTPEVINRYDASLSPLCWRCGRIRGSHYHILWQCDLIAPFWSMVVIMLQQILDSPIPSDPVHLLLGLPFPGLGKNLNKLASYVLLAAKRAIPACWLSTSPLFSPSLYKLLLISVEWSIWQPWWRMLWRDLIGSGPLGTAIYTWLFLRFRLLSFYYCPLSDNWNI